MSSAFYTYSAACTHRCTHTSMHICMHTCTCMSTAHIHTHACTCTLNKCERNCYLPSRSSQQKPEVHSLREGGGKSGLHGDARGILTSLGCLAGFSKQETSDEGRKKRRGCTLGLQKREKQRRNSCWKPLLCCGKISSFGTAVMGGQKELCASSC